MRGGNTGGGEAPCRAARAAHLGRGHAVLWVLRVQQAHQLRHSLAPELLIVPVGRAEQMAGERRV